MNFALVKTENATTEHALPLPELPALVRLRLGDRDCRQPGGRRRPPGAPCCGRIALRTAYQDFDLCALWFRMSERRTGSSRSW